MNRFGFHYFHDTLHYRQQDLDFWLPRLESLGTSWLVLVAPVNRAIPEKFIQALIESNIQPVLHFHMPQNTIPTLDDMRLLLNTYRCWGVHYVTLFDQPNTHKAWLASAWAKTDLVERFLDMYLPLAHVCLNTGLVPIFPPLKPGGDYWDTAFLRRALHSLHRRGQQELLDRLVIGAYSRPGTNPIQWGAGGPERWPNARPYFTPPGVEDQRGFRIFDWYQAISKAVLSHPKPIFLFGMGYSSDVDDHVNQNLTIARLLEGKLFEGYEAIPQEIIGGAFWPLVDSNDQSVKGWFKEDGELNLQAESIKQWVDDLSRNWKPNQADSSFIRHYLLLPSYEWGISDFHLDIIRPFIKKHQPTIGFSLNEAKKAKKVTIIGGEGCFSEETINELRSAGVEVNQFEENGMDIASLLATV